ncbi:MAG: chaperonin GroEL [Planctomycetaceae bacterium]|nr:chaperonin GroEL [Planctomycetaceae bacterium]
MPKQLLFDQTAREALRKGVQKVADAVRPTLGPRGRTVVIDKSWGAPTITKDGVSVCEEVELTDPFENMAAKMIKEAASKTSDQAGDGTTTSAILAEAIFLEGIRIVTSGGNPIALSRGIKRASDAIGEALKKAAEPLEVKNEKVLQQIGTLAAGNDAAVGEMLAQAFSKVGKEGAISVEEGKGIQTEVKIVEGMQFDRGFLSPHFVTNPASVECVLENPFILLFEEKLSPAAQLVPLLEKVAAEKRPLLVVAEDVEGEALALLVVNKLRGVFQAVAVKAPGYGDRRKAMLEDIGILTGAQPVFKDLGIELPKAELSILGRAKKVIVDSDYTTILGGAGEKKAVETRCEQIRKELETSDSDYDKEKLTERLSRLSGGVAVINVGAATETELKERKKRVEDALHSVRAALEEGVVPGGGVALLRAAKALDSIKAEGDEQVGVDIVRKAIEKPLRVIAGNAGYDPSLAVRKVLAGKDAFGFNAETGEFTDLKKAGVLDPVKVTRHALQNAASVSGLLLTTEAMVSDIPEPAVIPAGAGEEGYPPMG